MSIPTSLIVVLLVAAWLAVLVPMVARRREHVPETDADSGSFRVLRRASASLRRRPKLGRPERYHDSDPDQDDFAEVDEFEDGERDDTVVAEYEMTEVVIEEFEEVSVDEVREPAPRSRYRDRDREKVGVRAGFASSSNSQFEPAGFEPAGYEPAGGRPTVHRVNPHEGIDADRLRPVPRRAGRGGYDPDAAEAVRAYRYSRRRRVTLILLLATVAFSVAAYLLIPLLWSGTAVFGILLVAYLGYLRRQVRIEDEIRQRRLARLRRARQIRPEYHGEAPLPPLRPVEVSQVPPSGYRRGREIVDLEDDDPSFDDLDYYQPVAYRRASGQ